MSRPEWLNRVDEGLRRHQELGWARYVECPAMFAEGTTRTYTNEDGQTARGVCTGLMIQEHGEKIRRVVVERGDGKRDYVRVLDFQDLDD